MVQSYPISQEIIRKIRTAEENEDEKNFHYLICYKSDLLQICYRFVHQYLSSFTQTVFSWCFSNFLSSIFQKIAFANIFEVPKFSISLCKIYQPYHEKPNTSEMKTSQEKLKYLNKITDLVETFQPAFTHLKLTK